MLSYNKFQDVVHSKTHDNKHPKEENTEGNKQLKSRGSPCIQEQIINSIPSFQGYASVRKPKQTA